jgi:tetratricopeptide (TPR) repeat protein
MNYIEQKGITIRCSREVDTKIRDICVEFTGWIRKNIALPIKVTIYVRKNYKSRISENDIFKASFFAPYLKSDNPFIRVDVENHKIENSDEESTILSILESIAHEIVHYVQWIEGLPFSEDEAERKSKKLVRKFLKEREYDLVVSPCALKLVQLAEKYSQSNNFKKAIKCYINAIELGAEDYKVYSDVAYCYDCIEEYEKAILCYDKAIQINNKNSVVWMNKGYALHYLGQYKNAIDCFNESIKIKPSKEAYVFKAYSLEKISNYSEALECYDRAIDLDDKYDIAYNNKGQLLCHIGRFKEAKYCCNKAILINSNYADAYYNISIIYANLRDIDEARKYLNKAIEIDEEFKSYAAEEEVFKDIYSKLTAKLH